MNETPQEEKVPRNAESWAAPVETMDVGDVPAEAMNLNVNGRRPTGPLQGFGQLWQKTYRIRLEDVSATPTEVIAEWKAHFPEFWPEGNNFYGPLQGVQPGEVALLNLGMPGGAMLSTGVRVIYADDESFSFMTPQGHMFSAMITFSAYDDEGVTVIQIQALIRASDPIIEMTLRMGFGHKQEDQFWFDTLGNLAARFDSHDQKPTLNTVLVDKRVQWSETGNLWHSAAIRSVFYMPVHLTKRLFRRA